MIEQSLIHNSFIQEIFMGRRQWTGQCVGCWGGGLENIFRVNDIWFDI